MCSTIILSDLSFLFLDCFAVVIDVDILLVVLPDFHLKLIPLEEGCGVYNCLYEHVSVLTA